MPASVLVSPQGCYFPLGVLLDSRALLFTGGTLGPKGKTLKEHEPGGLGVGESVLVSSGTIISNGKIIGLSDSISMKILARITSMEV